MLVHGNMRDPTGLCSPAYKLCTFGRLIHDISRLQMLAGGDRVFLASRCSCPHVLQYAKITRSNCSEHVVDENVVRLLKHVHSDWAVFSRKTAHVFGYLMHTIPSLRARFDGSRVFWASTCL